MTSARVIVFLISTFIVISKCSETGECLTYGSVPHPDCKVMVVNNAGLRNYLLQRTLNFYQRYELNLNFEDYFIYLFSHMCDASYHLCRIKMHFKNNKTPFLTGKFEETYSIDDSGIHETINGIWNPYSSIYSYDFEKVENGFNFYMNSTSEIWFHIPFTSLYTIFRSDLVPNITDDEKEHFIRLQQLRRSTLDILSSLEDVDKFFEFKNSTFGSDFNSLRFQDYSEIKVILKQTSLNQTVQFECTNGDYNTYKVDKTVGNRLFYGYFRVSEPQTETPIMLNNKTTRSPSLPEEEEDESKDEKI